MMQTKICVEGVGGGWGGGGGAKKNLSSMSKKKVENMYQSCTKIGGSHFQYVWNRYAMFE